MGMTDALAIVALSALLVAAIVGESEEGQLWVIAGFLLLIILNASR